MFSFLTHKNLGSCMSKSQTPRLEVETTVVVTLVCFLLCSRSPFPPQSLFPFEVHIYFNVYSYSSYIFNQLARYVLIFYNILAFFS